MIRMIQFDLLIHIHSSQPAYTDSRTNDSNESNSFLVNQTHTANNCT